MQSHQQDLWAIATGKQQRMEGKHNSKYHRCLSVYLPSPTINTTTICILLNPVHTVADNIMKCLYHFETFVSAMFTVHLMMLFILTFVSCLFHVLWQCKHVSDANKAFEEKVQAWHSAVFLITRLYPVVRPTAVE